MNRNALASILVMAVVLAADATADNVERTVQAMKTARYPLVEAIRFAERQGNGPAIGAKLVPGDGHSEYQVKVLNAADKTVREIEVDAMTGKVTAAGTEPFETLFKRPKADIVLKSPMDLATAAITAQKTGGGIAIGAELDPQSDAVVYNVKLVRGTTLHEMTISPSGKVAPAQ